MKRKKVPLWAGLSMWRFHVLSVPMLCVFHITHKSRPYMLQKDTNWFVGVFNRTRSSVEIYVSPPVYWYSAAFHGFVFGVSWWSFWIFTFWVLMYLSFVFLLSWLFFILNRQKSSTCASFCLTCVQKAPPSQVHVLPFVLVKFLFPVDYCFWIWFWFGFVFWNPWFYLEACLISVSFLFPLLPEN